LTRDRRRVNGGPPKRCGTKSSAMGLGSGGVSVEVRKGEEAGFVIARGLGKPAHRRVSVTAPTPRIKK
jgi:hypothetical protein